jgi:PAS domain S-box-containing protein
MTVASNTLDDALSDADRALKILEGMNGFGWSADPSGSFTYVSRNALAYLGQTREQLGRIEGGEFGWRGVVHPDDYARVSGRWRHSLRTGETYEIEHRLRGPDDAYRWFRVSGSAQRDESGRITQWYGTTIDIEDQKRAETALRDRERELSTLVDMVPVHISRLTPEGELIFFNKRLRDFVGLDVADFEPSESGRLAAVIQTLVHPEDAECLLEAVHRLVRTGEPYSIKYRTRRADGAYRWVDGRGEPVRDESGAVVQWFAISIDVDDEMRAQEALLAREQELTQLVDMMPSHVWRLTPDGEPVFLNKRAVDFIGMDITDLDRPGMSRLEALTEVIHPEDTAGFGKELRRCLASGEPFARRYRLRRSDGVFHWMSSRAEPMRDQDGRIVQWYGLCHDIDDLVTSQEALEISRRQLEQMIDAVPFSILSFDPTGKLTYASKRYLEQAGAPPADIEDFDALARDVAHPEDFPTMFRRARDGFATGQPFVNRFRRRLKDGAYRWIEARAHPLRDSNGDIAQWYIASIDIEEEMRAQDALRERERFLWQLVETLPAMIDCAAPDGEPVYRSRQLREFLGYDLEKLDTSGISRLAQTLDAGVHPDDLAGVKEMYARSLVSGEPYARRHRLRRHDGEYRWVETRAAPMRDVDDVIVQWNVICLDIDGEVKAQEELRLARDRLASASQAASLAELSASIAHEVNQPLMAVVAYANACQRWLQADPPNIERAQRTMERTIHSATIAADVVSRIRSLFRHANDDRNATTMESLVIAARDLMAEEASRLKVRVDVRIEYSLPSVAADRVQIQQVLVNLMRNGMEAMDLVDGDRSLEIRVARDEGMVRTEVRDRGSGIAYPDRLFEPFFTTKEAGMGMGLAICRSIVESHGGRLWGENDERRGARFIFMLPIAGASSA